MYGSYRKRCRAYGGFFNPDVRPIDVFVHDKWKCHICGAKTHKVFRVGDPRSATVDHHPIPLSKGGDHDWHNVRCACFRCNSIKSDQWDGQVRLPMLVMANQ
jgi:5-methylcytosine-specific restriction endonuclease McrA